jgi:hypothetical protein
MDKSETNNAIDSLKSFKMINEIEISFISIIISLLLTIVCSHFIKLFYSKYGRSLNNRRNFSETFILLGITTTMVITVVKFSFALSLGLVGALSIVRFRAAIRDPEELIYLFLIIAVGISSGANQYLVTIFLTFSALLIIYLQNYFTKSNNIDPSNINLIHVSTPKLKYDKVFKELSLLFQKYGDHVNLKTMSSEHTLVNMTYEISMNDKKNAKQFAIDINKISSKDVTINLISNVLMPE